MVKKILKKILPDRFVGTLRILGYIFLGKLTYAEDCLYTTVNADFLNNPAFQDSYQKGKELMLDSWDAYDFRWRAYILCWAASQAKDLEGDFVECGVNTGMHTRMIIDFIQFEKLNKTYYLLDTFTGMDEKYSSKEEMARSKEMGYTSDIYESVKKTFDAFSTIKIIQGAVPATLAQVPSSKIAFLSIDMNCLQPEIAALEFFWDRMSFGGIILFDDYGFPGHENQKNAHDDFARRKNTLILPLPTGQGLLIKK